VRDSPRRPCPGDAAGRSPRLARLTTYAVLAALAVVALFWIGRASADGGGASPAATINKTVSNVATGKADAVDATAMACTSSGSFTNMPAMSETFSFGGTASRPVLVLFQAEWFSFTEGARVGIQLTIDGVAQSGPAFVVVDHRPSGELHENETHGFNFISDPLAPGMHTATIQWATAPGTACVFNRSLIVLHK
jgi:hypothetical protein